MCPGGFDRRESGATGGQMEPGRGWGRGGGGGGANKMISFKVGDV